MATERVAVVSGGSSGIGRAFVVELHRRGYHVLFCGRDAARVRAVEQACPGSQGYVCDLTDKAALLQFAASVHRTHPTLDLVISNAGGLREVDFTTVDVASTDLSVEIRGNLESAVNLIAALLPGLQRGAPSALVIITSGYALAPATRAPLYSASKAALRSLSKALRRQLAGKGVTVTEVAPPVVDTPAVAHRNVKKIAPETVVRQTLAAVDSGRAEVYPGAARWLPLLLRLAPGLAERLVAGT